ncbi:MAG: DUF896 domain-containing protein [Ruminococcaceae bacterium]|nr:DUF896 domain-containing protein [Oscillospiraceae bacterium]
MTQEKINKINEYARRVKAGETLTPEELAERDALRREYIESYVGDLRATLNNTTVQYPDGTKKKLNKGK